MDIFMGKVSYSVSEAQLHHKLAEVLHGPDYHRFFTSGAPLNFVVQLFHRRGQIGHKGCGLLHLPLVSVGQQFLSQYGGIFATRHVVVGMRRVEFKESDRPIRPDILDRINLLPYRDPAVVKEEQRIRSEYASGVIRIQTIQWGWETREPGVFSAEYERDCQGRGHLIFQDEPREIRIKTSVASETRIIAIPLGQIQSISVGLVNGQPIIFLSLNRAPIYESEVSTLEDNFAQLDLDLSGVFSRPGAPPPQRRRHSSFDDQHAATAAYSSLAIRLVCSREGDLNVFRSLCRTAKLTDWLNNHPPQAERGSLFSSSVRDRFAAWLQDLPWEVAFQVEMITRHLYMDLVEMLSLKDDIDRISSHPVEASAILREFSSQVRDLFYQDQYEAETVRECFVRCHEEFTRSRKKPPRVSRDKDDIFDCYHVMITPTSHRLEGPYPERLNRVIRKYPKHTDCFIRVSFVDENKLLYRFDRDVDGPDFIRRRVASVLQELVIAGQRLEFLAYSQSALKEHSVWYIRPFFDLEAGHVVDAPRIIRDLGNFHNLAYDEKMGRCPARYAARVSQSFTATDSSVSMEVDEVFPINDIERNGWCFSDGVGTISPELADDICRALYNRSRRRRRPLVKPRAFQIRFQGAKGMLSVDDRLRGRAICLRPSMIKFDAPNSNDIEIAQAFDRPSRYYLNRPLIMLLEDLGVPYKVFEAFQDAAVEDAENASESLNRTARLLDGHGLGTSFRITSVLQHLEQKLGITTMHDPFYRRMQEFAVHHVLREMKHKARIPVPGGWILVGVADIHGFLGPRDIFACTRCPDCRKNIYFEGPTLVSRSPTIHPGDVQVLNAIGRPPSGSPFEREPLKNSIVFSIQGERSIPSYLGGGDLDGDTYNVWSHSCVCKCTAKYEHLRELSLLPTKPNQEPGSYKAAPKKLVDHSCTMEDVKDFFVDYITSDVLGMVAINWLLIADYESSGIFHPDCYELAQVHSDAVDYPKSGQPVPHSSIPRPTRKIRPDWHAPETVDMTSGKYYESNRAIGRLFRAITLPALNAIAKTRRRQRMRLEEEEERTVEELFQDLTDFGPTQGDFDEIQLAVEDYIRRTNFISMDLVTMDETQEAWDLLQTFTGQIHSACVSYTLSQSRNAMLTEQELVIGTIVAKSNQPRRRKDMMAKMREVTAVIVRDARDQLKGDDSSTLEEWLRRSYVAWRLANLEEESFGGKSFWWVTLGATFDAIRALEEEEQRYDYI